MSFYLRDGESFISTDWTRGPWSPEHQHAGPPAALLARAVEQVDESDALVARITVELLRSVPVRPLRVGARVVRPGRRVQLVEATLEDEDGPVACARAWRIRCDDSTTERTPAEPAAFADPAALPLADMPDPWAGPSYFSAMEWRVARGDFNTPGPAMFWMRSRASLVDGEATSPFARVLIAADSGNGISAELPFATHLFINVELTVHVFREPRGEWTCLDARTRIGDTGTALAQSDIYDQEGRLGSGAQALLVATR